MEMKPSPQQLDVGTVPGSTRCRNGTDLWYLSPNAALRTPKLGPDTAQSPLEIFGRGDENRMKVGNKVGREGVRSSQIDPRE